MKKHKNHHDRRGIKKADPKEEIECPAVNLLSKDLAKRVGKLANRPMRKVLDEIVLEFDEEQLDKDIESGKVKPAEPIFRGLDPEEENEETNGEISGKAEVSEEEENIESDKEKENSINQEITQGE